MAPAAVDVRAPRDSFYGRVRELEQANQLLANRGDWLTLIGPPGIGKTRLAWELASGWADEVVFVELADVDGPEAFVARFAASLDVSLEGQASLQELAARLGRRLAKRARVLVVLDNLEHLVGDLAPLLSVIFEEAPSASLLCTSQQALGASREVELLLAPLAPEDAVELFVERAKRVSGHAGTDESVERLVTRLEGVPLAIELAAARTAVLTAQQVLERIDESIDLLTNQRASTPRHASLTAAIDWSFGLLDEDEARAIAAVSVFRSGFDADAAEAVLGALCAAPVVDVLQRLRERSLLRTSTPDQLPDEVRYDVYLAVRSIAAAKLSDNGDEAGAIERHAMHYQQRCEALAERLGKTGDRQALARLALEQANVLAAIDRCSSRSPQTAARLALAYNSYFDRRGPIAVQKSTLETAVTSASLARDPELEVRVLTEYAELHAVLGEFAQAAELSTKAEQMASSLANGRLHALSKISFGRIRRRAGALAEARELLIDAHHTATAAGDDVAIATAARELAAVAYIEGGLPEARRRFEEAIAIDRAAGRDEGVALALVNYGAVQDALGDREGARASYEEALSAFLAGGYRRAEANVLVKLANLIDVEADELDPRRSELYGRALGICQEFGDRFGESTVRYNIGVAHHLRCELDAAATELERAQDLFVELGHQPYAVLASANLAAVYAEEGELERARRTFADAEEAAANVPGSSEAVVALRMLTAVLRAAEALHTVESDPVSAIAALDAARSIRAGIDARTPAGVAYIVGRAVDQAAFAVARAGLAAEDDTDLWIGRDARWFRVGSAEPVSLEKRGGARRLLQALAYAHGGAPLSTPELFAAGWPDERADKSAAGNRVRVALSSLRKSGLASALERVEAGVRIRPDIRVRLEGSGPD